MRRTAVLAARQSFRGRPPSTSSFAAPRCRAWSPDWALRRCGWPRARCSGWRWAESTITSVVGFHRYSVDAEWFVPHFEKMLYDQAQIALNYLDARLATGDERHAWLARDILDYVARDLTSPDGGFYSAEDADSALAETGDSGRVTGDEVKPKHVEGPSMFGRRRRSRKCWGRTRRRFSARTSASWKTATCRRNVIRIASSLGKTFSPRCAPLAESARIGRPRAPGGQRPAGCGAAAPARGARRSPAPAPR